MTGESIPLHILEGVPGFPGTPQDEAGLPRKFETSPVGCATCRTTPISQSTLDKNPMPGHLFKGNPVGEVTIRRGTDTPVRRPEKPARGLTPRGSLECNPEIPAFLVPWIKSSTSLALL